MLLSKAGRVFAARSRRVHDRALLALLALMGGAIVSVGPMASPALACSCPPSDPVRMFGTSTTVFVAELLSYERQDSADVAELGVRDVRKGDPAPLQRVAWARITSCGTADWQRGLYLFYAAGPVTTEYGYCGHTSYLGVSYDVGPVPGEVPANGSDLDLPATTAPTVTITAGPVDGPDGGVPTTWAILGVGGLLVVAGSVLLYRRRGTL